MSQINPSWIVKSKILEVCKYSQIQQVGVDLTLKEDVEIEHGSSRNVLLNEVVKLPIDIYAQLIHRSSYNRKGVLITGSIYDPNYNGVIGCTIYNLSGEMIRINKNERICQMLFFEAWSASAYNGKYQGEHL